MVHPASLGSTGPGGDCPNHDGCSRRSAVRAATSRRLDGYALAEKAKSLAPELTAEIEFAESLMLENAADADLHRTRAAAAAEPGSLLALNLARD